MRRKGSSAAGIAAIWVIIVVTSVVILIPLAVLAWAEYSETKDYLNGPEGLKAYREKLTAEEKDVADKLKTLLPATGFGMKDDRLPVEDAKKFRDNWRKALLPVDPADSAYSSIRDFARRVNNSSLYLNISELCQLAMFKVALSKQIQVFFSERKKIIENRVKIIEGLKPGYNDHPVKMLPKIQQWMVEVQTKMREDQERFNARKAEIEAQIAALNQEVEDYKPRHERVMVRLKREWDEQMSHFKTLLKSRDQVDFVIGRPHIHGHIIAPNDQNKLAWIDIGSKHRVVNGMHFLVAKRAEKNQFSFKGEIEVKQTFMTSAEVEIMKVFDHDAPLTDGDTLINPMFNKWRPLVICLSGGDKPIGHRFSIGEATRRLIEYGNEVLETVDTRVDVLLWTDYKPGESEFTPEYWKAVELGIPIAKAKDLYKFLGD
jgi:hypothetical protein